MEFYGLLGERLEHSLSPRINKIILEKNNTEGAYKLFEIPNDKLGDFVNAIKLLKIKGFNVTIPYKESIIKYLDNISDEAARIGAVNTVMLKDNKLYGYNTDYFGIHIMLKSKNISIKNKTAVVLGAGGACKAVITYLLDNDVEKIYTILYSITVDLHQTVDNKENIAKFTNEYDKLVKAVKEENKQETLKELSELYNFLAGFIDDFSTHKKDVIVIKTKNDVFKAYSILDNEDWESVTDSINSATQNFARISVDVKDLNDKDTGKSKGKNDDQNISKYNVNKAYMMIEELQNAINLKEKEIFLIKYKNLLEELENV